MEERFCECGCGRKVFGNTSQRKVKRFVLGHSRRGIKSPCKEETKVKISKTLTRLLKEIRICICGCNKTFKCRSNSRRKFATQKCSTNYRKGKRWEEISPIKGKNVGEKIGNALRFTRTVRVCKCGCKEEFTVIVTSRKKYISGHNPTTGIFKNTSIELKLQKILKENNIEFDTQKRLYGTPDIFIEPNICIFADGDYWHKYPYGTEKDIKVNTNLNQDGYVVLRFWQRDINNNIEECFQKIRKACPLSIDSDAVAL